MTTWPGALRLAARLVEETTPLDLVATTRGGRVFLGFGAQFHAGGVPVLPGEVTSLVAARGALQARLTEAAAAMELVDEWAHLGKGRQAAVLSFLTRQFPSTERAARKAARELVIASVREPWRDGWHEILPRSMEASSPERAQRELAAWLSERTLVTRLVATRDTFLKAAPIDSSLLSDRGKRLVKEGEVLQLERLLEIPSDGHDWAFLAGQKDKLAIFMPHFRQVDAAPARPLEQKVNWSDFNASVSRYLTVGEVLRMDPRRRPMAGSVAETQILRTAAQFDLMREAWGSAIGVTSFYRPEPINSQIGGARNSLHVLGMAIDIYPSNGELEKFHQWLLKRWSGGYGDGRRKLFIHIDTREAGKGGFSKSAGVRPVVIWDY